MGQGGSNGNRSGKREGGVESRMPCNSRKKGSSRSSLSTSRSTGIITVDTPDLRLARVHCLFVGISSYTRVFGSSPNIRLTLRQGSNSSSGSIITHTRPPLQGEYACTQDPFRGAFSQSEFELAFNNFVVASREVRDVLWIFVK